MIEGPLYESAYQNMTLGHDDKFCEGQDVASLAYTQVSHRVGA